MENKTENIKVLAEELLSDIELSRLGATALVLKTSRLARLTGNQEIFLWLQYEMRGYNDSEPISLLYLSKTGRWINIEKKEAYFGSLATQEEVAKANQLRLEKTEIPNNLSGTNVPGLVVSNVISEQRAMAGAMAQCNKIKSNVLSLLHEFVSQIYYEIIFRDMAENIFEEFKIQVDAKILEHCGPVINKIHSISKRLKEGDNEAVSQALTSCRRIIDSFADTIFPPTSEKIKLGGKELELGKDKQKNRIAAYVNQRCNSKSRCKKLWDTLNNLYDRSSAGVHDDVTPTEARSLFLELYLFLGEVLTLEDNVVLEETKNDQEKQASQKVK